MSTTQRTIVGISFAVLIFLFLMPPVDYGHGFDFWWEGWNHIQWKVEHRNLFFWALFTVVLLVGAHSKKP